MSMRVGRSYTLASRAPVLRRVRSCWSLSLVHGLKQFVDLGLGDGSWSRVGVGDDGMELDDVVNVFLVLA